MKARAGLTVAADESTRRTTITRLRSDAPLALRPVADWSAPVIPGWEPAGAAHVALATSAAGPLGGDDFGLDVEVGPGAALVLTTVSASLLLPGPSGEPSCTTTTVRVGEGATMVWWPQPVIAACGCDHTAHTEISLAEGARLVFREELIFGRHGEPSGSLRQQVRVTLGGRPLHHQELHVGPDAPGWDGPAVTGGYRASGSVLLVDPGLAPTETSEPTHVQSEVRSSGAVLSLAGPATLITALGADSHELRCRLDRAVAAVVGRAV